MTNDIQEVKLEEVNLEETREESILSDLLVYCFRTPCIKCIPEKDLGYCPYNKLQEIFNAIKIVDKL